MFEGLKKKFSSFIDSLADKEKEKASEEEEAEAETKPVHEPEKIIEPKKEGIRTHNGEKPSVEGTGKREYNTPKKETHAQKKEDKKAPAVSLGTKIKGIFLSEVRISHGDLDPFMEQLRLSLLQSDVNYNVAEKILEEMRKELTSRPIASKNIGSDITSIIRNSILNTLSKGLSKDILQTLKEKQEKGDLPLRILFIGPNGAGKTTTIAKVANMLLKNKCSCIISASDTFRAAAIEQTVYHAKKLGVEVVKGNYGADPASIAFDAIAHAKAEGIDAVLIDSAGRQETNRSLMEEMRKMVRVAKPDLKIFIGESITGNQLLQQVTQFKEAIGLDGIILTKLDCDAKGGNTLSILGETNVPILYFGIGEKYDDIIPYDPDFVIRNIIPD